MYIHGDLTYKINGCLFEVYNTLGNAKRERAYEKSLQIEMLSRGLQAERQKKFEVFYFMHRVGFYYIDLLVEDTVIVELKVLPETSPRHQAQLISYMKGYNRPLGILANFGDVSLKHYTFRNKRNLETPLRDDFDFDKMNLEHKGEIKELLFMANRILITLGPGYFHQIYRRAFYYELKKAGIRFYVEKDAPVWYQNYIVDSEEVNFFIINGDLLLSILAVRKLDAQILSEFRNHIRDFSLKKGLIFNFNALHLTFKYIRF